MTGPEGLSTPRQDRRQPFGWVQVCIPNRVERLPQGWLGVQMVGAPGAFLEARARLLRPPVSRARAAVRGC